jgi:hypothetical protein
MSTIRSKWTLVTINLGLAHPLLNRSPFLARRPPSFRMASKRKGANPTNVDDYGDVEFGDGSFLADFDVDAAVAAAGRSCSLSALPPSMVDHDASIAYHLPSPAKRRIMVEANSAGTIAVPTPATLEECLRKYFGFSSFKNGQLEAVQAVLQGKDVTFYAATGR